MGASIARQLHADGMRLAIHYRSSHEDAHALQNELNSARPDSVILIRGDLTDVGKARNTVRTTTEAFGRLDVLVNNASWFQPTPLAAVDEAAFDQCLGLNLKVPFFTCQAAADPLRASAGCIVNIVDIYADRPLPRYSVYSASKAGLVSLTRSLAVELAPEVRVNAVAPGAILWPDADADEIAHQRIVSRTPLKRAGDPTDIARAVSWLVGDAPFTTGQVVTVDGGRSVVP